MEENQIKWEEHDFYPVVDLPEDYLVLDLNKSNWNSPSGKFCVGKYNEVRPDMYNTNLFEGVRNIHMGIDIGGPVGTPCMAFLDGEISHFGYNSEPGDYGFVLITKHVLSGKNFWALFGHLDSASISGKKVGQKVSKGEVLAWFGDYSENGGWEPHLHFQLSYAEPLTHDLPGVVSAEDRERAMKDFPDPRLVLGPIY
ncbi:MAG: peptidoglycan DD-metalloendopeptidase family protein [Candidatus Poseidoniales archaeon]